MSSTRFALPAIAAALVALAIPGTATAQCTPPYCPTSSSITEQPTNVASNSATLNGSVFPNGSTTHYHFELGGGPATNGTRADGYTYSSPDATVPGDDERHSVSVKVAGLAPSTQYHYRLVSTNQSGVTSFGQDVTFTTPAATSTGGNNQSNSSTGGGGTSTGGGGTTTGGGGGTTTPQPTFGAPSAAPLVAGRTLRRGTTGNDCLTFLTTADYLRADAGDDVVLTGAFGDIVFGGPGDDYLALGKGNDRAHGEAGDDIIYGDGQKVPSCAQAAQVRGAATPRQTAKSSFNDHINGGAGDDRIYGEAGNDRLTGGSGKDRISGGSGKDDIWTRDDERDVITCGSGRDKVHADPLDKVSSNCEGVRRGT